MSFLSSLVAVPAVSLAGGMGRCFEPAFSISPLFTVSATVFLDTGGAALRVVAIKTVVSEYDNFASPTVMSTSHVKMCRRQLEEQRKLLSDSQFQRYASTRDS